MYSVGDCTHAMDFVPRVVFMKCRLQSPESVRRRRCRCTLNCVIPLQVEGGIL
jgi:hypothetical protein